jgi:hypothetical protein
MRACLVVPAQVFGPGGLVGWNRCRPRHRLSQGAPRRCSWVPALSTRARASAGTTAKVGVGKIARVAVAAWATRAFTPVFDGLWAPCDFAHADKGEQRAFAHPTAVRGHGRDDSDVSLLTRCDRTDGRWWRSRRAAARFRCCRARHNGRRRCCRCRAPPTTSTAARCCCRFARSRPAFARRRA